MRAMICSECGHLGKPRLATRGHILIEIILWCCILIPGLIYSIWRHTSRYPICGACGAREIIPLDSPKGRRLVDEFHSGTDIRTPVEITATAAGVAAQRLADRLNRALGGR